jgi:branched-chain amino acid transport system ATP-binding protein
VAERHARRDAFRAISVAEIEAHNRLLQEVLSAFAPLDRPAPRAKGYATFPRLKERRNGFGNQLFRRRAAAARDRPQSERAAFGCAGQAERLAAVIVDELLKALGAIARSGGICSTIVEQHAQKILGLADRVVILERGAIVHCAASTEVRADPAVLERYLGVAGKS